MSGAVATRPPIAFGGVEIDLLELDDQVWIRKDQMAAALQHPLFSQASYYARYFSAWSTRMVELDGVGEIRLLSLFAAATVARRVRAPRSSALASLLLSLDGAGGLPSPRSDPPRGEAA